MTAAQIQSAVTEITSGAPAWAIVVLAVAITLAAIRRVMDLAPLCIRALDRRYVIRRLMGKISSAEARTAALKTIRSARTSPQEK